MSEKFSGRNSCSVSPLRSNTFVSRGSNPNKITSKRSNNGVKKIPGEKMTEEKKNEAKGCREEFGTNGLNLTLVGSPAPRSQVRALVSSTNFVAKSRVKTSYGSKSREQNPHDICMEKLYQFADNPTKFVRLESREEPQLQLDLEFSDRSEESENFYNSHNIAFGENGEYRIPEYDHIRFLQFSIGNPEGPGTTEDPDDLASVKFDRSAAACSETLRTAISGDKFAGENHASRIPDGLETSRSLRADGSFDLSETTPQIDEINQWNSKISHASNPPKSHAALDNPQNYPLGSAINYKNNINPEVEKFMLNTGPESLDEHCTRSTQNNRLIDESILSKNFAQTVRLQSFEGSVENSSRTSPITGRTTLSQASSGDGTWHGHSLNSPYFASTESNTWTDSKKNVTKDLSKVLASYEETEEYLTIVKNERDASAPMPDEVGVQRYIFITNKILGSDLHSGSSSDSVDDRSRDSDRADKSLARSSATESDDNSSTKMDRSPSAETGRIDNHDEEDISSAESLSDYCIGDILYHSSSSNTNSSLSSSLPPSSSSASSCSGTEDVEFVKTETTSILSDSSGDKTELQEDRNRVDTPKYSPSEVESLNLLKESSSQNVLYMTLEEVNLAADYTSKLSEIFNRVLKRSESDNYVKSADQRNVDCSSSTDVTSQNTSKLNYTCLGSPHFSTSHFSS